MKNYTACPDCGSDVTIPGGKSIHPDNLHCVDESCGWNVADERRGARKLPPALGKRANGGKAKISMLFDAPEALAGAAQVLMFGEEKYARGNWLKGLPWTEIMDSLLRHLLAFNAGEERDQESGLPHVDHVFVNAMFLAEMYRLHPHLDTRSSTEKGNQWDVRPNSSS